MSRTLWAVTAAFLLLVSACGQDDDVGGRARSLSSPGVATPDASLPTEDDDPSQDGADGSADANGSSGGTGQGRDGGTGGGGGAATPQPAPTAAAGKVNEPRTGVYTYDLEGSRTNPTTGGQRSYSDDARQTADVRRSGDIYEVTTTNDEESGSQTLRLRWTTDRVQLVNTKSSAGPGLEFNCTHEPPIDIIRFPVRVETYPSQSWSGDGCSGRTDIRIAAQETVEDARGRRWQTWRVETTTEYRFTSGQNTAEGTLRSTQWYAPDLGTAVKADSRNEGTFTSATASQPFSSDTRVLLIQHP